MNRRILFVLLGALLLPGVMMADPIAITGVGASTQKLDNGNIMVHFTVRVAISVTPLLFNYHWERSDGAKSGVEMQSVKPGVASIPVSTTWEIGPNAGLKEVWEKLFVNTGNTHLESREIRIMLPK
ncbi:MAG: hypothetical protein ACLQDL_14795 [Spirochaetia bacterium]